MDYGSKVELEQLRRGPEVGEGNQEGFDDLEGIGVFDDFLFVTQVNYFQIVLLSCQGVDIVRKIVICCLNLQEYRRYLVEYNVYSVLAVQTNFTQPLTRHLLTEHDPVSRLML